MLNIVISKHLNRYLYILSGFTSLWLTTWTASLCLLICRIPKWLVETAGLIGQNGLHAKGHHESVSGGNLYVHNVEEERWTGLEACRPDWARQIHADTALTTKGRNKPTLHKLSETTGRKSAYWRLILAALNPEQHIPQLQTMELNVGWWWTHNGPNYQLPVSFIRRWKLSN